MKCDEHGNTIIGSDIETAKAIAAELAAEISKLTVFEMAVAAKQIAAVRRLIKAVEEL